MYHRILFYSLLFLFVGFSSGCAEEQTVASTTKPITNYSRTFNDLNDLHKASAEANGIKPIRSAKDIDKGTRKLKKIETCKFYEVADLTHSVPYLVPKADLLLKSIGKEFQLQLKKRKMPLYKVRVTSVLRTEDNLKKLKRRNVNSSLNSAHVHATTFDISYVKYCKVKEDGNEVSAAILKGVLAEVLQDFRQHDECYVKYEVKQGCFHITVR